MSLIREIVTAQEIVRALNRFDLHFNDARQSKGLAAFASIHEILGIVTEEYGELIDAIHKNSKELTREELLDIVVACVFGVACIDAGRGG